MKKSNIIHTILKVLLTIILVMPILGATGIFPEPTKDMYDSEQAFNFIQTMIQDAGYIQYIMAIVFAVSIYLLWTGREAFSAILISPITINIIGFHLFLDGGLLTSGAIMGNIFFLLNIYFLWYNMDKYNILLQRNSK